MVFGIFVSLCVGKSLKPGSPNRQVLAYSAVITEDWGQDPPFLWVQSQFLYLPSGKMLDDISIFKIVDDRVSCEQHFRHR